MFWGSLKHLFVGALLVLIGTVIVNTNGAFLAQSRPAQLIVLQVDTDRNTDGMFTHRPTLGLVTERRPRPEYSGAMWTGLALHQAGDVIAGRYDPDSGKMQSDRMLQISGWMARLAQVLGVIAGLQGILILCGVPEFLLPLRVRIGRQR